MKTFLRILFFGGVVLTSYSTFASNIYPEVSCSTYGSAGNSCNQCFEGSTVYQGQYIPNLSDDFIAGNEQTAIFMNNPGTVRTDYIQSGFTWYESANMWTLDSNQFTNFSPTKGWYIFLEPNKVVSAYIKSAPGTGLQFVSGPTSGGSRDTPSFKLTYDTTYYTKSSNFSTPASHKECIFFKSNWCGDGVVDSAKEDCDLGAQNGVVGSSCPINCKLTPFDLSLKKYVSGQDAQNGSPVTVTRGQTIDYTFQARNTGTSPTIGRTTVSDIALPAGVQVLNPGNTSSVGGAGWTCTSSLSSFSCYTDSVFQSGVDLPLITLHAQVSNTAIYGSSLMNYSCVQNSNENRINNFGGNNCDEANVIITPPSSVSCVPGITTGNQINPINESSPGLCPTGKVVGDFLATPTAGTLLYSWSCDGSIPGGLCQATYTPGTGVCTPGSTTGTQTAAVTAVTAGLCPTGQAVGGFTSTVSGTTINYSWSCNGSPVGGLCVASYTPTVTPGVCTSLTASVSSQTVPTYSSILTCTAGASAGASPTFQINCGNGQIINAASGACNYTAFGTNSAFCSVNGQTGTDIPNACRVNITSTTGGGGGPGTCKELSFSPISNVNSTLSIGMSCTSTVAANPNPTFEIDCGNGQTISGNTGICTYSTAEGANFPYTTTCRVNGSTQGGLSTPPGTMAPGSCIQSIGYSAGAPLPPGGGGGGPSSYCGNGIVDSWTKTFSTGSQIPGATCTSIYRNESVTTNGVTTNVSVFDHYDCIVTTQETCDAGWLNGSPLNNLLCVNCQTQTPTTITNPSSNPLLISYYPSNLTRPQGLTVNNYQWIVGNNVPVFDPGDKFTISSPYPTILVGYSATIANISNLLSPNPATVSNPFGANECIGAGSVDFGSGQHSCIASKSLFTVTAGGVATPSYGGTGQKFIGNSSSITGAAEDVNPPLSSGSAVLQNNFTIGIGFLREPLQVRVARQAVSNTAGGNAYIGVKTGYSVNAITNEFLSSIQTGNFVVTSSASATADALSGADSANVTSTSQSVAVGVNGTSLIPVDVQVLTMSDFNFARFAKLGDAGNIYSVKKGTVTIDGDLQLKGIGTVLIEEGTLIINGNITYEDANSSWAFIVVKPSTSGTYAGTAIQIKNTVDTISGVYMALAGEMIGSSASIVQLSVDGNIYANIAKLVNSRTFIRATEGSTALSTGVTINYSTRAFKNPPPLLSKYLEQYTLRKISR